VEHPASKKRNERNLRFKEASNPEENLNVFFNRLKKPLNPLNGT
jgi:hypothetical protein